VRLPQKHHFCIWCGHVLWNGARSDEHIIPSSLGGRLICVDVCVACNNRFGGESDWKLLHDKRVFDAAVSAGIPAEDFLGTYEATTSTNRGTVVKLRVVKGESRVIKGLGSNPFHIGSDGQGNFPLKDVESLRSMMYARNIKRLQGLDPTLIKAEVDRLIESVCAAGLEGSASSSLLGEGLACTETSGAVIASRSFNAFETDRAVAKILFTLAKCVLPQTMERPMAKVFDHLKGFALAETANHGPIHFEILNRSATRRHRLEVNQGEDGFRLEIVLFDVLRWWISGNGVSRSGDKIGLPAFRWKALDDQSGADVTVEVSHT
jgi:hypothetical protein